MFPSPWLRNLLNGTRSRNDRRRPAARQCKPVRLMLEPLEDRVTPSGFQTLYSFTGGNDGKDPETTLSADSNGNLYGTTSAAGANGEGTVFQLNPGSQSVTTPYSFSTNSGYLTYQGVIRDSNGNLYGTTVFGGSANDGTVFKLSPDGQTFSILHSFIGNTNNADDGVAPESRLIMDNKGNLYGTTAEGGTSGFGTVFELSPDGSGSYNYTVLHSLNGSSDGSFPVGSLFMDSNGNIYGIAVQGGADSHGTVFQLSPDGSGGFTFSVVHTFTGGNDGAQPYSNLVMDSKGNLYGTTTIDGPNGLGTVYEFTPSSNTFTTIYGFRGSDGNSPNGNLLVDFQGNLYGVTESGGTGGNGNDGTAFELSPDGTGGFNLTTLHNFTDGSDGRTPLGGLTADNLGNLYGTDAGGANGDGTIFELTGVVNTVSTTTAASNASVVFSSSTSNVTLTAQVTTSAGTVNQGTVTFTVLQGSTVIGTPTTSGTVRNGQASVSYSLPAGVAAGTYTIDAVYNPVLGLASSSDSTHTLTVQLALTVTANPSNQTVTAGSTATFTASASGNPTPTVQWQVSSNGATWSNISGATSTTLTLKNVTQAMSGEEFQAVFTNSAGSVNTSAATLTVQAPPAFTSANNTVFTVGQAGSFLVTTNISPAPTLTEFGVLPSGVTFTNNGDGTATLAGVPAAGTQGTYSFTITANNDMGSAIAQSFTLTVNPAPAPPSPPQPPALHVPPLLGLINGLLKGAMTVNADGTETMTYGLYGFTLITVTFDSSGNFLSGSILGFGIPNWIWFV